MGPGDLLVLATDGLIELQNENHEMFGRSRLEGLIREYCTLAVQDLVMAIQDAVAEFLGDCNPLDDVTLMVVERKVGAARMRDEGQVRLDRGLARRVGSTMPSGPLRIEPGVRAFTNRNTALRRFENDCRRAVGRDPDGEQVRLGDDAGDRPDAARIRRRA